MTRPTSWLVFGILNLVFGGFGLLGAAWNALVVYGAVHIGAEQTRTMMERSPVFAAFTHVSIPLGLVAHLVLVAAGIALIQARPAGRILALCYACYDIVLSIIGGVITIQAVQGMPLMQQGPVKELGTLMPIIMGFGVLLSLVYPVLMLVFLGRDPRRRPGGGTAAAAARPASDNPYQSPGDG